MAARGRADRHLADPVLSGRRGRVAAVGEEEPRRVDLHPVEGGAVAEHRCLDRHPVRPVEAAVAAGQTSTLPREKARHLR